MNLFGVGKSDNEVREDIEKARESERLPRRTCDFCGVEYQPRRPWSKYCSFMCKTEADKHVDR